MCVQEKTSKKDNKNVYEATLNKEDDNGDLLVVRGETAPRHVCFAVTLQNPDLKLKASAGTSLSLLLRSGKLNLISFQLDPADLEWLKQIYQQRYQPNPTTVIRDTRKRQLEEESSAPLVMDIPSEMEHLA